MRKTIGLFLVVIVCSKLCVGQDAWDRYQLGTWGEINIPPSMEIQSGIYKQILDNSKRRFSVNAKRVVFQQRGVNQGRNLDTYARIIIRTDEIGNVLPDLNLISHHDLTELDKLYKEQLKKQVQSSPFPVQILNWNGVNVTILGSQKALNYSYIRKMKERSTYSGFYLFWIKGVQHSINIEYRMNDSNKWENVLKRSLNSFTLESKS